MAWVPYLLVAVLLVMTRVIEEVKALITHTNVTILIEDVFGSGIAIKSTPLYLPGAIFIVVSIITYFLHGMKAKDYMKAWSDSFKTVVTAGAVVIFAVPMIKIFINTQTEELASMPLVLAEGVSNLTGSLWYVFAPTIGALGAS